VYAVIIPIALYHYCRTIIVSNLKWIQRSQ